MEQIVSGFEHLRFENLQLEPNKNVHIQYCNNWMPTVNTMTTFVNNNAQYNCGGNALIEQSDAKEKTGAGLAAGATAAGVGSTAAGAGSTAVDGTGATTIAAGAATADIQTFNIQFNFDAIPEDIESDNDDTTTDIAENTGATAAVGNTRSRSRRGTRNNPFGVIRTTIVKPKKRNEFKTAHKLEDLKKIYLNKKLTKFSPACLETIFEDPNEANEHSEDTAEQTKTTTTDIEDIGSQVRFVQFGSRKLRRSISFCDGINAKKSLIKRRRAKIKKTFGRRYTQKKISMAEFHERLNKSLDGQTNADIEFEDVDEDDDDVDGADADIDVDAVESANQLLNLKMTVAD